MQDVVLAPTTYYVHRRFIFASMRTLGHEEQIDENYSSTEPCFSIAGPVSDHDTVHQKLSVAHPIMVVQRIHIHVLRPLT